MCRTGFSASSPSSVVKEEGRHFEQNVEDPLWPADKIKTVLGRGCERSKYCSASGRY